jgi:hypothetical protein
MGEMEIYMEKLLEEHPQIRSVVASPRGDLLYCKKMCEVAPTYNYHCNNTYLHFVCPTCRENWYLCLQCSSNPNSDRFQQGKLNSERLRIKHDTQHNNESTSDDASAQSSTLQPDNMSIQHDQVAIADLQSLAGHKRSSPDPDNSDESSSSDVYDHLAAVFPNMNDSLPDYLAHEMIQPGFGKRRIVSRFKEFS